MHECISIAARTSPGFQTFALLTFVEISTVVTDIQGAIR